MQAKDGPTYFARVLSYACKMFMKLTTGLMFDSKARAYPNEMPRIVLHFGQAPGLNHKS